MSRSRRHGSSLYRKTKIKKLILWTFVGLVFYTVFFASIDRIVYFFELESNIVSAQLEPSESTPLLSNAFKLGHGLTQLRYADADDHQYIKWKNQTIVQMVALGIDVSVMHEAIEDCKFTLDETIVLSDQIRSRIKKLHGTRAASTFAVGAELIPATRAFEMYLKDNNYRDFMTKSNMSILQLGSSLNVHLDEAVIPENLKIDLVAVYAKMYPKKGLKVTLDQINKRRERILNHFLKDDEDTSGIELL